MCAVIENPASCKVLSVIRFLFVENHKPIENHRQLCKVYENEVMSEGRVKQWCIMFKNDRTNVHDEERSGRPTIVTDELVAKINEKIHENRRFTITELFPNMKTWLATQRFDDDAELQAGVNEWSLRRQNSMTMEIISLCTVMISASIWTATMLKNSLRLWLSIVYNKKCFLSLGFFLIPKRKLLSG